MKNIALITGASSGIGKEFARIHASKGGDLILVARRIELLNRLKEELIEKYKVAVQVIQKDLSVVGSSQALQVSYLVRIKIPILQPKHLWYRTQKG